MGRKKGTDLVPVSDTSTELPPILTGRHTAAVEAQVRSFYISVAEIFERWVTRRSSTHTQRAYRQDVMDFVRFGVWQVKAYPRTRLYPPTNQAEKDRIRDRSREAGKPEGVAEQ